MTGLIVEQASGTSDWNLGDPSCLTSPAVAVPEGPVAAMPLAGGATIAVLGAAGLRRRRRRRGAAVE